MEVEQPLLERPFYLREASTAVLLELGGAATEQPVLELIPTLSGLLGASAGASGLREVQPRPKVFAGDGGSGSRVHADNVPRVQFCHVVQGVKLFTVEHDAGARHRLASAEQPEG